MSIITQGKTFNDPSFTILSIPASDDTLLIWDTSLSGLRRVTYQSFADNLLSNITNDTGNSLLLGNTSTAGDITLTAQGSNTDVSITLTPKGAGQVIVSSDLVVQGSKPSLSLKESDDSNYSFDWVVDSSTLSLKRINILTSTLVQVDSAGTWNYQGNDLSGVSNIIGNASSIQISTGTSDTTDNAALLLSGGGGNGNLRGGAIRLYGNEAAQTGAHTGLGGVTIQAGIVTNSAIDLIANSTGSAVNIRTSLSSSTIDYQFSESGFDAFSHNIDTLGIVTASRVNADNLRMDNNTLSSTDTDGNVSINPNGTGVVEILSSLTVSKANGVSVWTALELNNTTATIGSNVEIVLKAADNTHGVKLRSTDPGGSDNDFEIYVADNDTEQLAVTIQGGKNFVWHGSLARPVSDGGTGLGNGTFRMGQIYSTNATILTSSDVRLKSNIQNLNYGLNEILQLKPRSFDQKYSDYYIEKIGFVAQEVESILPEFVETQDDKLSLTDVEIEGMKSLKMGGAPMTAVLVNAIQELNAKHEAKSVEYESRISALEAKLLSLEEAINNMI